MMVSIVDAIIILFLLTGAVLGFKKGLIKSVVSLVGTILVVVLSLSLKNPLSVFLYTYFPFFNVGVEALNILIYEGIAFIIVFALLTVILKIVIKISGLIETVLKFTIILAIPSKIFGAIFGFIEYYIFAFIILFLVTQFSLGSNITSHSKLAEGIMSKTPFISSIASDTYQSLTEIVALNSNYNDDEQAEFNQDTLDILLKYKVISVDNLEKLIAKGKIENNAEIQNIINKYKGEKE